MGWQEIIPSLVSLATLVGLIAKVLFDASEKKRRDAESASNVEHTDAETSNIHAEISASYAEEIISLRDRMGLLETEVGRLEGIVNQQARTIRDLRAENKAIQKRADALEKQVVELGGVPYNNL